MLGPYAYSIDSRGVVTVSGQDAMPLLSGLSFDTQGTVGHEACDILATRLGLSLDVSPASDNAMGGPHSADFEANFIRNLYASFLNRAAGGGEVEGWRGLLRSAGRDAVIAAISDSPEADQLRVLRWYELFLQRRPQAGEEAGWVNLLRTQSEEFVLSKILGSEEFARRADALFGTQNDPASYVKTLYLFLLNRPADPSEVNGWLQQLPQLGRAGIAQAILTSQEFREGMVDDFYLDLLGRARGNGEGLGFVQSGLSLRDVQRLFAASEEFFRR